MNGVIDIINYIHKITVFGYMKILNRSAQYLWKLEDQLEEYEEE